MEAVHRAFGRYRHLDALELLSPEEEVALGQVIEAGLEARRSIEAGRSDPAALRAVAAGEAAVGVFAVCNLRLVIGMAGRCARRSGLDLDDVVQDGMVGLLHAIRKFDWRRGHRFSTYATWWIRRAIQQGRYRSERAIRIPERTFDLLARGRAVSSRLQVETGAPASADDVAERLGVPVEVLDRAAAVDFTVLSLDAPAAGRRDGHLGEQLAAEDGVERAVVHRQLVRSLLDEARDRIPERAWQALVLRFGLDGEGPRSFAEIGEELGISRETARLDLKAALRVLTDAAHARREG